MIQFSKNKCYWELLQDLKVVDKKIISALVFGTTSDISTKIVIFENYRVSLFDQSDTILFYIWPRISKKNIVPSRFRVFIWKFQEYSLWKVIHNIDLILTSLSVLSGPILPSKRAFCDQNEIHEMYMRRWKKWNYAFGKLEKHKICL